MKTVHAIALTAAVASITTAVVLTGLGAIQRPATVTEPEQTIQTSPERARRSPTRHTPPTPRFSTEQVLPGEAYADESELDAQVDSVIQSYERQFRAEPVSLVWAKNTELAVFEALVSKEAEAAGIQLPDNVDVQCRTSLCRISADYADDGAAADAATILAMDISEHLPRTHRRTVYGRDGSAQLLIFAMQ